MPAISRDLLRFATDEELVEYHAYLEGQVDAVGAGDDGPWVLQPRQQVAEDGCENLEPGRSHELLYGGTAGPGKSEWLLWHLHNTASRYPKSKSIFLRRTFPELIRSAILRSLERFDRDKCRYVASEKTWRFTNGSSIEFGYCERDLDVHQYQSAEYDVVAWDELTQWPTDYCYRYLFSRNRTRESLRARGFVPHIVAGTNPGGVGGLWVKERFVDPAPPETRHTVANELPMGLGVVYGDRIFIPGKLEDNRYIDKASYVANLANLGNDLMMALLAGSWDVIEGRYFTEWNRDLHVVKPFEIPSWWPRIGGVDYGYVKPFANVEAAFDQDGTCWVYREDYGTELTPKLQAEKILARRKPGEPRPMLIAADPSMFARTGIGKPIAQQYSDNGVYVRRALNDRKAGWAHLREYLRPFEDGEGNPRAGLYVFDTCTNLIRTLPMLVRDDIDPEDLNTDGEDHTADTLRYLVMTRPPRSRSPKQEPNTVEARMAARRKRRERARRGDGWHEHPQLGRI